METTSVYCTQKDSMAAQRPLRNGYMLAEEPPGSTASASCDSRGGWVSASALLTFWALRARPVQA